VAEDVTDLVINLIGNSASAVGAYERATVAGTEAAAAAERAKVATVSAGEASAVAGGAAARAAGDVERSGNRWTTAAERGKQSFKGLGLAAAAIFVGSIYSAVEFEKQMELIHTQAGASQAEVKNLTGAVLAMAPAVGIGPTKLAEGLYHIESVGYRGADAMKVLKASADGAKVGNADLDATTYALTSVMNTFGLKASDAGQTMAQLNAIVGTGDMRMQDLNGAIGSGFLAAADTFGISLQSAGAALAYLTDRGSKADESATRLKMSFALLGAPSGKAAGLLKAIGIGAEEVHARTGAMTAALKKSGLTTLQLSHDLKQPNGLGVALQDLKTHLANSGLSASQAATLISKAFGGGRSGAAIMSLYAHLDVLKQKFDAQGVAAKNFGQDVEATHHTAAFAIDALKASVSTLAIRLGTALLPAFRRVVQIVTEVVAWLGKHTATATALVGFLGGAMLIALAAYTVSMVAAAAATIAATWPILAVIAALTLLVAGFVYAWQKSESFRDVVLKVIDVVKTGFYGAVYLILGYVHMLVEVWGTAAHSILHAAAMMLGWVPGLGGKLKAADRAFSGFKDGALDTISKLQDGMKTRMEAAAKQTAYQSALTGQALKAGILDRLPAYQAIADKYGKTLPQVLRDARLPAGDAAKIMTQAVDAGVRSQLDRVRAGGQRIGAGVVEGVAAHVGLAGQAGQNLAMSARGGVSSVGGFDTLGANAGQGYVKGMQGMITQASNAGANIAAAAMAAVQAAQQSHSPSRMFHNLGRHAGQGYAHGMRSTHGMISEAARDAVQAARDAIADRSEHHGGRVHHPRHHSGGATPHAGHPHQPHQTRAPHHGAVPACIPVCKPKAGQSKPAPTVVHMHVHLDGREIHRSVQMHELQYQGRNPHPSTTISRGSSRAC